MSAYAELLRVRMTEAVSQGVYEWLATVKDMIPVWSGASRATLLVLARRIEFEISINPTVESRVGLGLQNAQADLHLNGPSEFYFSYSTTLDHLVFNEYNNANLLRGPSGAPIFHLTNPGPYNFQGAGQGAFKRFAATVTLPSPYDALKPVTIRA